MKVIHLIMLNVTDRAIFEPFEIIPDNVLFSYHGHYFVLNGFSASIWYHTFSKITIYGTVVNILIYFYINQRLFRAII